MLLKELQRLETTDLPGKLDAKLKNRAQLAQIAQETFGHSYHVSLIMLNQGLMPGYERTPYKEIASVFYPSYTPAAARKRVASDITRAKQFFSVGSLFSRNYNKMIAGVPTPTAITKKEDENVCICGKTFTASSHSRALCPDCASKPSYKRRKCSQCGEMFRQTDKNRMRCETCTNRDRYDGVRHQSVNQIFSTEYDGWAPKEILENFRSNRHDTCRFKPKTKPRLRPRTEVDFEHMNAKETWAYLRKNTNVTPDIQPAFYFGRMY